MEAKATIVKNDQFTTIGFEVVVNNECVFNWGISPTSFYFTKEVSLEKYSTTIFEIIRLNAKRVELEKFMSRFFDCIKASKDSEKLVKHTYNLSSVETEISDTKKKIALLIQDII